MKHDPFESDRHTRLPERNMVRTSTRRRRLVRRISRIIRRISGSRKFPCWPRVWKPCTARRWRLPRREGVLRTGYTSPPRGANPCASCWRRGWLHVFAGDLCRHMPSRQSWPGGSSRDRLRGVFRGMARIGGGPARRDFGRTGSITRGRSALPSSGGGAPGPWRARRGSHRP